MTRGMRVLCLAAVAVAILIAGCGGGGTTTTTSTTAAVKTTHTTTSTTTTSKATTTTTSAAKTTTTTSSTTVALPPANKTAELTACKSAAKAYTKGPFAAVLPSTFASSINAICAKIASGDLKGAKAIAVALCNQVADALPSGVEKSTVAAACKKA
jgi:hypothetical protein